MPKRYVTQKEYDTLLDSYRKNMTHAQAGKAAGVHRDLASSYYRFGFAGDRDSAVFVFEPIKDIVEREKKIARDFLQGKPTTETPNSTVLIALESEGFDEWPEKSDPALFEDVQTIDQTAQASGGDMAFDVSSNEELPKHINTAAPLWHRYGSDLRLDTRAIKEAIKDDKEAIVREISEEMRDTIISQTSETIAAVEDRLDSIRYAKAVKGLLAQQAPMVKQAISVIGKIVDDLDSEVSSLTTMQKVSVLQRVSGYISTWQSSVEAAIRLERLLLGEPENHVAVSEMSQEDAIKKIDRLRALAEQAKGRIVSDS